MCSFSNLCFLCLNSYKNLKTLSFEDSEGIIVQNKLKHCLPEIVDLNLEITKFVCNNCMSKLDCFYKFKQLCLQNSTKLRNYLQSLTPTDQKHEHLSMRLNDTKYQNVQQSGSKDQTLPIVESDDELQTGVKEDIICNNNEADASNEIATNVLDPLFVKEKDIIVKEECFTPEDYANNEFYHEFVKCESISSDSDVSISGNEDALEVSTCSNNNSEDILTNNKDKKISVKNKVKEIKKYHCALCNRAYLHKISLEYHYKVHSGIKEFSCSICHKMFKQTSELMRHERIHTGVRNFQCLVCKKKFKQRIHLTQHEKIHTGIRNFNCSICNKQFMRKTNLIRHEQIHTGIKNFECLVCKKKFTYKCNLLAHERIHSVV